ncbi:MAG: UDP-3-O-(3-hydroxymyristoyl)glucosamine N-acyltransferase [Gammaproteobacteria bacterium]|nr:UDP-3-O-(3-hydroxymyristoyl)glucosamine N-acyltransferase [Gammaproteobacteria bacterium]
MPSFRLVEIADRFELRLQGDGETQIDGVATLQNGRVGAIGFLANRQYRKFLPDTRLSAVILGASDAASSPIPALVADDPYLAYARVAGLFMPRAAITEWKIHPSAVIDPLAVLGDNVCVGANVVIERGVVIGAGSVLGSGSVIEADCRIGDDTHIAPNVTICHDTVIGARCRILPGAVIGSRGFGLAPSKTGWVEVPQLGRVRIGDDCEIGANTTVDRGAVEDTVIENGVKLDNLVQVAHNVRIGEHTVVAGCTGIAGSAEIGAHTLIGGAVAVLGHLSIPPGSRINAGSLVSRTLPESGSYSSGIPVQTAETWNKNVARLRQLSDFVSEMRALQHKNDDSED